MITTREARLAAEAWLREEAGRHPELVGAILAGSARTRAPEDPHPPSSDVDLFIYVDAEVPSEILEPHGRFAPRKLAFRGVVLEPSFHEARRLADPEAVLGDMHLAPLFTEPHILLDPDLIGFRAGQWIHSQLRFGETRATGGGFLSRFIRGSTTRT